MKRFLRLLLIIVSVTFFSCMKDGPDSGPEQAGQQEQNYTVPLDQALADLNSTLEEMDGDNNTRSGKHRTVKEVTVVGSSNLKGGIKRSSRTADSILYIANLGDNEGYAILAADSRLTPVIAITDEGSLTLEQFIEAINRDEVTPAIKQTATDNDTEGELADYGKELESYIFGSINNYAIGIIDGGNGGGSGAIGGGGIIDHFDPNGPPQPDHGSYKLVYGLWKVLVRQSPLTITKWNQGAPYNLLCPVINGRSCYTGCVATALAQIIVANKIKRGIGPDNILGYQIDWNIIRTAISNPNFEDNPNTATSEHLEVAQLMRNIGTYVNMQYGLSGSSAYTKDARYFLEECGYLNTCLIDYNTHDAILMTGLLKQPIYVSGLSSTTEVGHAWVLDGLINREREVTKVFEDGTRIDWPTQTQSLLHCNFGWGAVCDGYYDSGIFILDEGPIVKDIVDNKSGTAYEYYDTFLELIPYHLPK